MNRSGTASRDLDATPLLAAARGQQSGHTPVWFMRQAGRSLPEYRELRGSIPMLEACLSAETVCEITLQPVRRHGVDAAILFSDIVLPLYAAGVDLDIVPGTGPVVAAPVRDERAVAELPVLAVESLEPVSRAVRLLVAELGETPLIGFAGGPFTLASYLVEGGPSKNHEHTKALMHSRPDLWHALAAGLAEMTVTSLTSQVEAGVDAVQLFDSWAGALSEREYREYVLPHSHTIFDSIARLAPDLPKIHFGVGTGELLGAMRQAGADVVGVDWRVPLPSAVDRLADAVPEGAAPVVQGNLDPAVLHAGAGPVEREVGRVLAEGRSAGGHIFNLGHGVLPNTDPDVLTRIVELVHATPRP